MSTDVPLAVEPAAPGERLRIAVLANFDSVHARTWVRYFALRGHDVHAISYYPPGRPIEGVQVHALRPSPVAVGAPPGLARARRLPPWAVRLVTALRFGRAGLAATIRQIQPDVLQAHYLIEHGFYALAAARFRPLVVTVWGSDVLLAPERSRIDRLIARRVAAGADALTSNNAYMGTRLVALGARPDRTRLVVLGAERYFLEQREESVNLSGPSAPPTVLSTRSLDSPLYNVDTVIRAFARARRALPDARLMIAGQGRLRPSLEALAASLDLGDAVQFVGHLPPAAFREALSRAHVFVSVPSSDGTSVAVMQAMAAGCFPVLADIPSQYELVTDGENGFRTPVRDEQALAARMIDALRDPALRRQAAEANLALVMKRGLVETELGKAEALFREMAGKS